MFISLDIKDDNKAKLFLEFLKTLDFVTVTSEDDPIETEKLLNERLEEYESNPAATVDLKDALQKLKIKYGF